MIDETQPVTSIPWHRLTTAYGRGTDVPDLIKTKRYNELANLIEHQSTLWQVTPWVLMELLQELTKRQLEPEQVALEEIELYLAVASAFTGHDMESLDPVGAMNELLDEKYLWPEDDQEDEVQWEEEEPPGYDPEAFSSYYYYSYILLKRAAPVLAAIKEKNQILAPAIEELMLLLERKE